MRRKRLSRALWVPVLARRAAYGSGQGPRSRSDPRTVIVDRWRIRSRRRHKAQVPTVLRSRRSVAQSAANFCLARRRWSDGARPVACIVPACSAAIDSTFSCVFIICTQTKTSLVQCYLQVRHDSSSAAAQTAQDSSRALCPRLTLKGFNQSRTFTTHSVPPRALFTPVLGHSVHMIGARN